MLIGLVDGFLKTELGITSWISLLVLEGSGLQLLIGSLLVGFTSQSSLYPWFFPVSSYPTAN